MKINLTSSILLLTIVILLLMSAYTRIALAANPCDPLWNTELWAERDEYVSGVDGDEEFLESVDYLLDQGDACLAYLKTLPAPPTVTPNLNIGWLVPIISHSG